MHVLHPVVFYSNGNFKVNVLMRARKSLMTSVGIKTQLLVPLQAGALVFMREGVWVGGGVGVLTQACTNEWLGLVDGKNLMIRCI